MKSVTPRNLALAALDRLDQDSGFPDRYLSVAFQQASDMSGRDRAFTVYMVQGVLRWRLRLDWIISQSSRFSFKRIEPRVLNILRLALCQIFFMDRVPESAAVNEAVKQAKALGRTHVAGFVNGILRHICRQKDRITLPDCKNDRVRYLSIFYSYPIWLVEKWDRELGMGPAEDLLAAGNRKPRLVIRTNSLKTNRAGLIRRLEAEGASCRPTLYSPDGIEVEDLKGPVNQHDSFTEGLFQVQDEAAQVCSYLLHPGSGESILDLCAGLGGKSTHLAQLMGNNGRITSLDINHRRLIDLAKSSHRLGIDCIQPVLADAGNDPASLFRCSFEKILMDGPCSGLGVLSRHPDGKWARDENDIRRLSQLQKEFLDRTVPLLRGGGRLLYVTCTISREENEDVVNAFLRDNRGMFLEDLKEHIPGWGLDLIDDEGFLKTYPHIHGMDGFFGALFRKDTSTAA